MITTKKNSTYILLLSPVVVWIIVYYFFDFDGLYGQDSYEYFRYSKALRNFFINGENPGDYFWPLYYPAFGSILSLLIKSNEISLLLISVLSLSISAIYLQKLIKILFKKNKNSVFYLLTFFLFSPYILRSSMVIMSDMLAVCFIVLLVYNYYKFKFTKSVINFYGVAAFSVMAVMTRYASAIVVLPMVILAILQFFKLKKIFAHIPFLILISALLVLPHFIVRSSNYGSFLSHQWLQSWSTTNFFKSSFITLDGISHNLIPNLLYVFSNGFHPGYISLGLPLIIVALFKPVSNKVPRLIIISISLYALFLAGIPFQNNRFLLLTFPLVIICLFPAYSYLMSILSKNQIYFGYSFIILIQFLLILRAGKPFLERNHFEIEMTELLKPYQNQILYSFDIDIALKGRGLNFDYHNLWEKRYTHYKEGSLLLFHPAKFKKQWDHKNPILNWNYLNSNYNLKIILNCPKGWKLYKIQAPITE